MTTVRLLLAREHWYELSAIMIVGIACLLFMLEFIALPWLIVAVVLGLYDIAKNAFLELLKEKKVGTELFITIAVLIALIGGEYLAGAVVLMIILIAEYISSVSGERARASIRDLIGTVPKVATVKRNGKHEVVDLADVNIGDVVLVRAGEKIPVDGTVASGGGAVNQAPITGESMPQEKFVGSEVYAGTILESGALDITVTRLAEDTVFSRIVSLVEEAEGREPTIQKFTDKVAAWLIPAVFVFVFCVYLYTHDIKLIIALLIFTSPAELGLATPLVTISAIARAAREGILVKGGLYLEALARADTFVFDKTGTLTLGSLQVDEVSVDDDSMSVTELVTLAASADSRSAHPLARAIVEYAERERVPHLETEQFEVINGRGVKAVINGQTVLVGNQTLFEENAMTVPDGGHEDESDTVVYLAVDGVVKGHFHVTSTVRPGAKEAIASLRASGVERIIMLTGDHKEAAKKIAGELAITEIRSDLLPEDKIKVIDELQQAGHIVAMVGDGINDAPALAAASVGVAMGTVGTESAMEAADIVLVNDDLKKLVKARSISRFAYRTIKQNIFVGVGVVHVVGIVLVLTGVIGPVEAAIIHLVPDTLVFLNSTKLLRVKL